MLQTSVIGSWAFPGWYAKFCDDVRLHPEMYGADDREEALRDAVRLAVEDQLRAGADLISDGEMQRVDFNLGFYDRLTGIRPLAARRLWGSPAHDQRDRYSCTSPLAAPAGLGLVEEFRRLRTITTATVKVPIPGPFTLAGCIDGGEIYRDRRAVTEALLPIVNAELKALQAEGVTFLQLDEPSFACRPDAPEEFLRLIDRTVEGIHVPVSLHMCFGNFRGRAVGKRSYRPLFPHLARAKVQQLALEFASREMAEIDLAREIPAPMGLAVGLVDVKNTWIEPPEFVAERLRQVLRYVEPERVHVTPDCGFSQTARYLAVGKLTSLVQGTRQVRRELGHFH
jgi:5-methyltetrahydropteroyltriglutamate--homocysteine methyltransferase